MEKLELTTKYEFDKLRQEIQAVRRDVNTNLPPPRREVDVLCDKLTIRLSGLMVFYTVVLYAIQKIA